MRWTRISRVVAVSAAVLMAVTACASGGTTDSGGAAAPLVQEVPGSEGRGLPPEAGVSSEGGSTDESLSQSDKSVAAGSSSDATADRQVIQSAYVSLIAKDPDAALNQVRELVSAQGATARVDSLQQYAGVDDEPGWATITARIPASKLQHMLEALSEVATVSSVNVTSEDVTAAAVDLDARITAQRVSVERMTQVLSTAATTADVIAAEEALTRRQADLEQMVAERNRLADQVALSTVTVDIYPPTVVDPDSPSTFGDAVAHGWNNLVTALQTAGLTFAVLLPWLLFVTVVTLPVVWLVRARIRTRRQKRLQPADTAEAVPAPQMQP